MLQIYKKVEKTLDNPSGVVEIQSLDDLSKPFLICLSAQDSHDQSVFGIIKEGARAARVNTTDERAAGFKIDEFPISFLGLKFIKDNDYAKSFEEIVDKLLYPFLVGDKNRSVDDIKHQARKINFLTYCDGTLTYENAEKRLEEKLHNDGYAQSDISDILAQISVTALGTMVYPGNLQAKTTAFIDVNDTQIYTERTFSYIKLLQDKGKKCVYGLLRGSNNALYLFDGSGKHFLKEYFRDDSIVKPALSSVLATFLQNSMHNFNNSSFEEISMPEVIKQLNTYSDDDKEPVTLLNSLDNSLNYGGAAKYTKEEATFRHELEVLYAQLYKTRQELANVKAADAAKKQTINSIVNGLREYSSETTFYQVLVSANAWQAPMDRDVFAEPSDKDIRTAYEQLKLDDEPDVGGQKR